MVTVHENRAFTLATSKETVAIAQCGNLGKKTPPVPFFYCSIYFWWGFGCRCIVPVVRSCANRPAALLLLPDNFDKTAIYSNHELDTKLSSGVYSCRHIVPVVRGFVFAAFDLT